MTTTMWKPVLTLPVSPERDHIQGPVEAPITLVEYGDYECPLCGAAHPSVKAVQKRLGDQMRFVFRHFPLTTMHPHAEPAAEAAEAAGAQGKFWGMHDMLYENQPRLRAAHLKAYAAALGLATDRFVEDLTGHVNHEKIREDFMSGVRSGVNGTPTFYINGLRHDGTYDYDTLVTAIERTLVFR